MKLSKGEKPLEIEELLIELGLHDKKGRLVDRDKVCVHKEGDYIELTTTNAKAIKKLKELGFVEMEDDG